MLSKTEHTGICKSVLRKLFFSMGVALAALSASAQNPVFDITNSSFKGGAKCDGHTDDQPAIQAAATAAAAYTGTQGFSTATVFTPPGKSNCILKEPLVLDNFQNIRFISGGQTYPGELGGSVQWLYTGTASPAISMRSVTGISTDGVYWGYSNASFTGTFIEMTHSSTGGDSVLNRFSNSEFAGIGVHSAAVVLSLDKTTDTIIENSLIADGQVLVRGASGSGSYSNVITFLNCAFPTAPGVAYIQNPGANWTFLSNDFELFSGAPVIQFVNNFTNWAGMVFANNFVADATGSAAYTMFSFPAQSQSSANGGLLFIGNVVSGSSTNQTEFSFGNYSTGIVIHGNDFPTTVGTLISVGVGVDITVGSNNYGSGIHTFLSGTPFDGSVLDNTGTTTVYGATTFANTVTFNGQIIKPGGSFRIDHPLDPQNKYLYHSFVESPDMKNMYDGIAVLDSNGRAEITLPAYFEALNKDFRYQLTCLGKAADVYVAEEIKGNRFVIAGGKPGQKVSWQVTGIRHDAYANAHRIVVEEDKPSSAKSPIR